MRPIETEYKGYRFRSRLEAKWAVFFDACKVDWEYEPEGFVLDNGQYYLPDFLLHGVEGRSGNKNGDLYVEVKGKMSAEDASKIYSFCGLDKDRMTIKNPIYIVSEIPFAFDANDLYNSLLVCADGMDKKFGDGPFPFNVETVDGDFYPAFPCINMDGKLEVVGCDYVDDGIDEMATLSAFRIARQARFEHGEKPIV